MNDQDLTSIAIVGMACRLPGADNLDDYWDIIQSGRECFTTFTDKELRKSGVSEELIQNRRYVRTKGVLRDIDLFDADFFGFTPQEAKTTDPQHRLFLECAWEALEDAGYDAECYPGKIGVFGGQSMNDYMLFNILPNVERSLSANTLQLAIGNDKDSLTTKVSYKMNLRGPGITVQSSSSTSLTSIGIACQNLLCFECDMALAGGVCIGVPQEFGYSYQEGGIISHDGRCRTFDDKSSGFVIASGAGVIILKRLEDAVRDGDHIYCVIDSLCMNNDGRNKASYSAPSVDGICNVISESLQVAGVDPGDIGYIEAHGTGTRLGDLVEFQAMKQAYEKKTRRKNYCAVGSVKANIGHVDAAAGVAGLIKVALCLYHGVLPPHIGMEVPNRHIDFISSPFYINQQAKPWLTETGRRRAAVTSIGMGGTNAHAILSDYKADTEKQDNVRGHSLLILSARTEDGLRKQHQKLAESLRRKGGDIGDIAYTLQIGRKQFSYRAAYLCRSLNEAILYLDSFQGTKQAILENRPQVAFELDRPSSDICDMEFEELCKVEPTVYQSYLKMIEIADQLVDIKRLFQLAIGNESEPDRHPKAIIDFIRTISLAYAVKEWGIHPDILVGNRINEYAAAHLANVLSFSDVLLLLIERMQLHDKHGFQFLLRIPQESITRQIENIRCNPVQIPFVSTETGTHIAQDISYWREFFPGREANVAVWDARDVLELSLSIYDSKKIADFLGKFWLAGGNVSWKDYQKDQHYKRVSLPTYPYDRKRYWIDANISFDDPGKIVDNQWKESVQSEEQVLADLWRSLLGMDEVGLDDNYFELGGTSLLATQIISTLSNTMHISLPLTEFYSAPTIRGLALKIRELKKESDDDSEAIDFFSSEDRAALVRYVAQEFGGASRVQEIYPLTASQERMLFQSLFFRSSHSFQQNYLFSITGKLEPSIVVSAINILSMRHDALHSVYTYKLLSHCAQIVLNDSTPDILYQDLRFTKSQEAVVEHYREKDLEKRFDLLHSSPMRLAIFRISGETYKLMLSLHHIALDALSFHIITDEFIQIYAGLLRGKDPQRLPVAPYKSYMKWYLSRDRDEAIEYWNEYLKGYKALPIVLSKAAGRREEKQTQSTSIVFNAADMELMTTYAKKHRVTFNALFLFVWCMVVRELSNTDDVLFGTVISGRPEELDSGYLMVGLFSTIIPLRVRCSSHKTVSSLIQKLQDDLVKGKQYDYLPLMDIVQSARIDERNFHYIVNIAEREVSGYTGYTGKEALPFHIDDINLQQQTGFPLCCIVEPAPDSVEFRLEYQSNAVDETIIERIAGEIRKTVEIAIINDQNDMESLLMRF